MLVAYATIYRCGEMRNSKSVGRIIANIHKFSDMYINQELESYKIGSSQLHFLNMLYQKDGINQEYLAHHLNKDKATSARAIKKLEEEGYVIRKRDDFDKRSYAIFLTKKSKDLMPVFRKILREWTKSLLINFSESEKKTLYSYLERISENAERKVLK